MVITNPAIEVPRMANNMKIAKEAQTNIEFFPKMELNYYHKDFLLNHVCSNHNKVLKSIIRNNQLVLLRLVGTSQILEQIMELSSLNNPRF